MTHTPSPNPLSTCHRSPLDLPRFGLRTTFIDEGKFTARVLGDGEAFPVVENVDISDIKVPVSRQVVTQEFLHGFVSFSCHGYDTLTSPHAFHDTVMVVPTRVTVS